MVIKIDEPITDIHEISAKEFNVLEINSIAVKHKDRRQESKAPTFALT